MLLLFIYEQIAVGVWVRVQGKVRMFSCPRLADARPHRSFPEDKAVGA
jgi:hypothetical protein